MARCRRMHGVATGFEGLLGGSDARGGEVEGFCSRWGYGITCLSHDMLARWRSG